MRVLGGLYFTKCQSCRLRNTGKMLITCSSSNPLIAFHAHPWANWHLQVRLVTSPSCMLGARVQSWEAMIPPKKRVWFPLKKTDVPYMPTSIALSNAILFVPTWSGTLEKWMQYWREATIEETKVSYSTWKSSSWRPYTKKENQFLLEGYLILGLILTLCENT